MAWIKGKPRNPLDARDFIRSLVKIYGWPTLAKAAGVDKRTLRHWATDRNAVAKPLVLLVEALFPVNEASIPLYDPDMAICGHTRVGGVGEYTLRSARGLKTGEVE